MSLLSAAACPAAIRRTSAAAALALLAAAPAMATENSQVRALLGAPSYELATPQFPGWYGQLWVQHYEATQLRGDDGEQATSSTVVPGLGTVPLTVQGAVRANVLVPRITYVTEKLVFDGRLGFSATLPVVEQTTHISLVPTLPAGLPAPVVGAINAGLAAESARRSGSHTGLADPELAAFVDWAQDESRLVAGFAVNAPLGDYDKARAVNTGAGKYWTFKPLLVASRVWESGLELGLRATYSFNTRNSDTDVRSGQYLHADWAGLWRLNDQLRIGLQGYVLKQFTKDAGPGVADHGNKVQALSAGPAVAYIAESGTWALDLKVMQEFSVRNRPEGTTSWVRLNMRLD
ncbi:SphA family protein [Ideonella sp. BN130291]|uniref:SphA family protein n=1 Tax=Ideonella sp. BN130291 TaxID=3112940 RepID=UPI002E25EBF5|nr:transporter [Ideonella sp. BN130291]